MITGIDHVVILAKSLAQAVPRFERLGFMVERGGRHPVWGTENALIALADGTYIELLAAHDGGTVPQHRLWRRSDGTVREPGTYGGYALQSDDLAADVSRARQEGLVLSDPQPGSRIRPDGQMVQWRLVFSPHPDLPFLIQDDTPRPLRVAPPRCGLNPAARIAVVTVVVQDSCGSARRLAALLGPRYDRLRVPERSDTAESEVTGVRLVLREVAGSPSRAPDTGVAAVTLAIRGWDKIIPRLGRAVRVEGNKAVASPALTGGADLWLVPS